MSTRLEAFAARVTYEMFRTAGVDVAVVAQLEAARAVLEREVRAFLDNVDCSCCETLKWADGPADTPGVPQAAPKAPKP